MRVKLLLAGFLACIAIILLAAYGSASVRHAVLTLRAPNGEVISLIIADTAQERARGLGDRASLGEHEGMLFMFPESGLYSFWMQEMEFPLDIVWLTPLNPPSKDGGKKKEGVLRVVDVKENILPDTFPESFTSREEAQYVLEINAGVAFETGIRIGETMTFAR